MPGQVLSRRGLRSGLILVITVVLSSLLAGCPWDNSDDEGDDGGAAITVSVVPANPSVQTGATLQFTATVANSSNTSVTWQVNNVTGGAAATGTISNAGLFTAPAAVPNPATVTVKAISAADAAATSSVTVTITSPAAVSVDVQPPTANVQVGHTQQFTATVANAANTAVTWALTGAGCAGATCGTVSASGNYTAPAAVPNPATVTVTATSAADPTKSDTALVTVVAAPASNPLGLLNGRYVLTTMDQERNGFVTGTLDFNGTGQVTGGTVDLNIPEATAQTTISGGTYTIAADGRGKVALNVTGVGAVHFAFVVVTADLARIIYFEPTSSGDLFGTLERQTSTSTPTGKYVFRLEGTGLTGRRGYVGLLDFGASTSALDFTEPVPTGFPNGYGTTQVFTASVALGAADAKGRGTLTIDSTETGTMLFAYWVINATRLAIIPADPVAPIINGDAGAKPASGGVAEKQGAIGGAGNVAAGNYVYTAMGADFVGVFVKGGRIASTGAASSPAVSDETGDAHGQALGVASSCDTTVSAAGRSDMFCIPGSYGLRTFFIDGNRAFTLVYGNDRFGVGELYKQSAASFTGADVAGNYSLLAFGDETANNVTGAVALTDTGGISGTEDTAEDGETEPDVSLTGSYTLNANGTADSTVTAGGITNQHRTWIVSPARIIGFTINDSDKESLILDRQDLTVP